MKRIIIIIFLCLIIFVSNTNNANTYNINIFDSCTGQCINNTCYICGKSISKWIIETKIKEKYESYINEPPFPYFCEHESAMKFSITEHFICKTCYEKYHSDFNAWINYLYKSYRESSENQKLREINSDKRTKILIEEKEKKIKELEEKLNILKNN